MDVYLIPVGPARHELYCEVPDEAPDENEGDGIGHPAGGFFSRLGARWSPRAIFRRVRAQFGVMLAEAERERRQGRADNPAERGQGWMARAKTRTMRWVAESIAEQRLLWHLRGQTDACLFYPNDIEEDRGNTVLRSQLRIDFEKHRFWLIINSLAFVASGVFFFVPGPNAVAYYFAFRLVGHFLSMRGARQGLSVVKWRTEASAPLAELRRAIALEPAVREHHVHDVALRLRLEHLASFFERTADPCPGRDAAGPSA
jgi:K+-H+ exchange-related protein